MMRLFSIISGYFMIFGIPIGLIISHISPWPLMVSMVMCIAHMTINPDESNDNWYGEYSPQDDRWVQ